MARGKRPEPDSPQRRESRQRRIVALLALGLSRALAEARAERAAIPTEPIAPGGRRDRPVCLDRRDLPGPAPEASP